MKFVIVGCGRVGSSIARTMLSEGHEVSVLDEDPEAVAQLEKGQTQGWEDLGVTVLQGYGATETGTGACTTLDDHGPGTVGRTPQGITMRIAESGEILGGH